MLLCLKDWGENKVTCSLNLFSIYMFMINNSPDMTSLIVTFTGMKMLAHLLSD